MHRIALAYERSPEDAAAATDHTWLRNPMMDVLAALAHSGSISGAARALGLSYRHVWGQLKHWEAELGHGLVFWERGQAAHLTPFGERLLAAERLAQARMQPQLQALRAELARAYAGALAPEAHADTPVLDLYAGEDLALSALAAQASQADEAAPALHLRLHTCGSLDAVRALAEGRCEIAGLHAPVFTGAQAGSQTLTARSYRALLRPGLHRGIGFARRTQGLIVAPGNPLRLRDLQDVVRQRARFVNRAPGSGTRLLLEELLALGELGPDDVSGHERTEPTHAAVAQAVAGGSADVGLGTEYAARAAGLDFVPLVDERYLLVCLKSALDQPPLQRLLARLGSRAWQARLGSLPGYHADHCGEVGALRRLLPWWD